MKGFKFEYYQQMADDEQECQRFLQIIGDMEKNFNGTKQVPVENIKRTDSVKDTSHKK